MGGGHCCPPGHEEARASLLRAPQGWNRPRVWGPLVHEGARKVPVCSRWNSPNPHCVITMVLLNVPFLPLHPTPTCRVPCSSSPLPSQPWQEAWAKKKRLRPRNRPQPLRMGTGTGHHWGLQQWGHPTSPSPGRGQAGGGPDAVVQKTQLSSSATGPGLILGTREQGTRDRGATRLISAAPGASPVLPRGTGASGAGWEPHTTSALPCGWGWDVGASGKEPLTLPGVRVSPGCGGDR